MIGIIIQARMGSSRLTGKILMNICGKPMLWYVVKRCQQSKLASALIVATPKNKEDDRVEDFCMENHINYFRGSSSNVLKRYYQAAKKYHVDNIVRITADCPLMDPLIIDRCIKVFTKNKYDYISNVNPKRTYPRGLDVEVFSFKALEKAYKEAKKPYEKEHVTPYIWENKKKQFFIGPAVEAKGIYRRNYRLTVDYPKDLELMQKIYQRFYNINKIVDVKKVISYLDKNPLIAKINSDLVQKSRK